MKNRHKLAVILIVITILAPTLYMVANYRTYYNETVEYMDGVDRSIEASESLMEEFLEAGYILYNLESDREGADPDRARMELEQYYNDLMQGFDEFYPYLDYRVEDEDGKLITKSIADSKTGVTEKNLSSYELGIMVSYDEYGRIDANLIQGNYKEDQRRSLRTIVNDFDDTELGRTMGEFGSDLSLELPKNRTYLFGMTEENLELFLENRYYTGHSVSEKAIGAIAISILLMAAAGFFYPMVQSFRLGEERIFRAPFELVAGIVSIVVVCAFNNIGWRLMSEEGWADVLDVGIWFVVFAVVFWGAVCLRQIYTMGVKRYMKERTILVPFWQYFKKAAIYVWKMIKEWVERLYRSFNDLDLNDKNDKKIFKIVLINFVILTVMCMLWFFGVFALVVYSVVLFFILRKYFNDLQEKYKVLLRATNQIAEGDLDVEITEDLGVFRPFRTEIGKIQKGFKKAVDEEVKSQKMKTELITNVSHDLKTPLTAIITYVNLLKEEEDREKQREYIEVLDRKSLRLKVLIEDLFEISKASSKNVTLNLMDVDVVNLFKQVKLELEDKFAQTKLDFRSVYPEEKLVCNLDSQKTYRIFENLLNNVAKYALPGTRVYVKVEKQKNEAVLQIMNVSAAELDFNADEIAERFVRGDAARNTEGSGLGLAIAKSFTELQKGKFKVEIEGDLFKVKVGLPLV